MNPLRHEAVLTWELCVCVCPLVNMCPHGDDESPGSEQEVIGHIMLLRDERVNMKHPSLMTAWMLMPSDIGGT